MEKINLRLSHISLVLWIALFWSGNVLLGLLEVISRAEAFGLQPEKRTPVYLLSSLQKYFPAEAVAFEFYHLL